MKNIFILLLTISIPDITAQGIIFEKNTTWEQVVAKAKAENKLIFVDCYTTWCGPCKKLDAEVFPNPEVGAFFNKNFVNLKVQMDTVKNDSEYTRQWWAIGQEWHKKYGIWAYPGFLVFDSNGEIAERGVGYSPVPQFLEKGKELINTENHYYRLRKQYEEGKLPEEKLSMFADKVLGSYDRTFITKFGPEYLAKQKDLLTQINIRFITQMNPEMGSVYFNLIRDNIAKVDQVMEQPGVAENYLYRSAQQKFITKLAPSKVDVIPDWVGVESSLRQYFPDLADKFLLKAKINRANSLKIWIEFSELVQQYFEKYTPNVENNQLNSYAWSIFQNCEDLNCINLALNWAKHASDTSNDPGLMDTYANLLYKAGQKDKAVAVQQKAVSISKSKGDDTSELQSVLDKMMKGEKTW
jgi:thioredoxin-related protein